jgi:chaperone BCS1
MVVHTSLLELVSWSVSCLCLCPRYHLTDDQGIGVVLTVFRRSVTLASTLAQRRMLVTLEIPSKDRSYPWFLEWMSIHAPQPQPTSIPASAAELPQADITATTKSNGAGSKLASLWKGKQPMSLRSHELAVETTYKQHENGASEAVFNLVPGPGTHYFKFRGSWFQVSLPQTLKCCWR